MVREAAGGPGYDALVAAHGRALAAASGDIATAIRTAQSPCKSARLAAAAFLLAFAGGAACAAPDTLAQIKSRGELRCGVSEGIAGFSIKDAGRPLVGARCRFLPRGGRRRARRRRQGELRSAARHRAVSRAAGRHRSTCSPATRPGRWCARPALKMQFAGVLYYDGQAFMVPAKSGIKTLAGLKGATVCVDKGTTTAQRLADYSADAQSRHQAAGDRFGDRGGRRIFRRASAARLPRMPRNWPPRACARRAAHRAMVILPERISKEPLGPAVRAGDDDWLTLVRWVLFAPDRRRGSTASRGKTCDNA